MAPMQGGADQMKAMQQMHEQMVAAKTPDERNALMAEHMKTMHENMQAAKGMMGDGMGCSMMKDGMGMGMMQKGGGSDAEPMMQRMQGMEKRMDMMQMMMEQMAKPAAK